MGAFDEVLIFSDGHRRVAGDSFYRLYQLRNARNEDTMYDFSYRHMAEAFSKAIQIAGFGSRTLYELRHGGASDDAAAGASMLYVQKRRRWASDKPARRYAKEGILPYKKHGREFLTQSGASA